MFNRIETKPKFQAVGFEITCHYENTSVIPEKWKEFMQRHEEIGHAVNQKAPLGIALRDGKEDFDYLICLEVSSADSLPSGMTAHTIGTHEYAVFTHHGEVTKLGQTYQYIYEQWLPQSEYNRAPAPFIEVYDEKFCEDSPESVMEVWIPIVKK